MSKWGRRIEFSKGEIKALLRVTSQELVREIHHHAIDPELTNVVKKAAQCLHKFNENECPFEEEK